MSMIHLTPTAAHFIILWSLGVVYVKYYNAEQIHLIFTNYVYNYILR